MGAQMSLKQLERPAPVVKPKRRRGRPPIVNWENARAELVILIKLGYSVPRLARHIGNITPNGLRYALRRLGLATKRQQECRDGTPS